MLTDEGISICTNDEHPLKACFPIDFTEGGNVIVFNEVQ